MRKPRVLVVDDESAMLENCERMLVRLGYVAHTLASPSPLREVLREFRPEVLLLDLRLPGVDGFTVLAAALADDPHLAVIIMTAYASVTSAVRAVQEGAFDYLGKPFTSDQLDVTVRRACTYRGLVVENRQLRERVAGPGASGLIGGSDVMGRLLEQARKVGPSEASVLITGESGTGKELVARCLHRESARRNGPFVPIDCGAMPETLLEAELFGHERGAFTGAVTRKIGLLVAARGGTVFLDEVTECTLTLQAKLLRTLEERKVRPVGSNAEVPIDVRIVAATNRDVDAALAAGVFRADLFYRLNVVRLDLPPLRERDGDLLELFQHFLRHFAETTEAQVPQVTPEAWEALARYQWPGNVRELRNVAQRLVVLHAGGKVCLADLPGTLRGWSAGGANVSDDPGILPYAVARDRELKRFQGAYARRLLAAHQGNVTRAAERAQVSRRTLHRWIADLGHDPAGPDTEEP